MKPIAQDEVVSFILQNSVDTFPQVTLLSGMAGSGRHTVCSFIGEQYKLPVEEITTKIEGIELEAYPKVYIIDLDKVSQSVENALLKILEEPPVASLFILICSNESKVLHTLKNRCYILKLAPYTKEVLRTFLTDSTKGEVLKYADTPGEVVTWEPFDIEEIHKMSQTLIEKIEAATVQNVLSICSKISFDDNEVNKIPLKLFIKVVLEDAANQARICKSSKRFVYIYKMFNQLLADMSIPNISKDRLLRNALIATKRGLECC